MTGDGLGRDNHPGLKFESEIHGGLDRFSFAGQGWPATVDAGGGRGCASQAPTQSVMMCHITCFGGGYKNSNGGSLMNDSTQGDPWNECLCEALLCDQGRSPGFTDWYWTLP